MWRKWPNLGSMQNYRVDGAGKLVGDGLQVDVDVGSNLVCRNSVGIVDVGTIFDV